MTTIDTDALTERIAEAAYRSRSLPAEVGMKRDDETSWAWTERMGRAQADQVAAAVLPIVAEEVRKAKAEALREAADSVHDNASSPYCLPCHRDDADLLHTIAAEYETGDSDEHR